MKRLLSFVFAVMFLITVSGWSRDEGKLTGSNYVALAKAYKFNSNKTFNKPLISSYITKTNFNSPASKKKTKTKGKAASKKTSSKSGKKTAKKPSAKPKGKASSVSTGKTTGKPKTSIKKTTTIIKKTTQKKGKTTTTTTTTTTTDH